MSTGKFEEVVESSSFDQAIETRKFLLIQNMFEAIAFCLCSINNSFSINSVQVKVENLNWDID